MSLSSVLEKLATFRNSNARESQEVFKNAELILNSVKSLGDDGWTVLEQLFLAAMDMGRLEIADKCLQQLSDQFRDSPRVEVLTGIRMEASEPAETVLQYYTQLLDADEANMAAWKRKISVLRRLGRLEQAVTDLSELLDIFYNDVDGWLELTDIYTSCHQYSNSLQSLSHALLLAPQNPFYVLQYAETAYTAGDIPLALKYFLVAVDMLERELDSPEAFPPSGIAVRAWLGVKLCARHLMDNSSPSASSTAVPNTLNLIEELATERVLAAYPSEKSGTRSIMVNWVAGQ
ncbi:unnamed protein product [Mycena citricolor]|uniref:ER membrane protein complex subunit 2 n=1 Tax=Mycena citricolor TaxID=2018698 RepID=A0AAD2GVF8_9AGAR|nr:unnamed protein product [Mycena citricolor]